MIRQKPYLHSVNDPQPLNWQCSHCHLLNPPDRTNCSQCSAPRLQGKWPDETWLQKRRKILIINSIKKEGE